MQRFLGALVLGAVVSLLVVAGIVLAYRHVRVNQTTVALSFLLTILAVSAVWGMLVSAFMSMVAMLAFNYFFLPRVGTLTIADPQNWVAMLTFGEGWHNNHHAAAHLARHGLAWYEFDVNWYGIWALRVLGLAWDVKRPNSEIARKPRTTIPAEVTKPEILLPAGTGN
jgi:fatty-acid desaturase